MIRGLISFILMFGPGVAFADCSDARLDVRGDFGAARFTVEVADDPAERSRGLMFREELPRSAGMLFVYPEPVRATFWMENTPLPLDLVFIDPDGRITRIHENAIPFDRTTIDGGEGVQFVLEINGGLSELMGLRVGDEIRHPAISGDTAVWPCS